MHSLFRRQRPARRQFVFARVFLHPLGRSAVTASDHLPLSSSIAYCSLSCRVDLSRGNKTAFRGIHLRALALGDVERFTKIIKICWGMVRRPFIRTLALFYCTEFHPSTTARIAHVFLDARSRERTCSAARVGRSYRSSSATTQRSSLPQSQAARASALVVF